MHRLVQAQIDLGAIAHNFSVARRAAAGRKVWPVVKADAYGHGMDQVVQALPQADGFCVADLDEGVHLRTLGVRQPVLVIQGAMSVSGFTQAAQSGLVLGLHDLHQLDMLEACASRLPPQALKIWLKVDTGMYRLGLRPEDVEDCRRRLQRLPAVAEVGLMTHFACADEVDHPLNAKQVDRFLAAAQQPASALSGCNSAALLSGLLDQDQIVRPGIMLYGASPFAARSAAELGLRPAMRLVSRLLAVKQVQKGGGVGYGSAWVAERDARIGLVGIGYGDGYPRHAGTVTGEPVQVALGAQLVPVRGRVSMDSLAVDLTACPDAGAGDEVVLWGDRPGVDEVAQRLGTIGYELVAGLTARVPRTYGST